jgi:hypothetical protein
MNTTADAVSAGGSVGVAGMFGARCCGEGEGGVRCADCAFGAGASRASDSGISWLRRR